MAALMLKNNKGQTMIEWLLLVVSAVGTAYLVITGPFADFTTTFLSQIRSYTNNIVLKGESDPKASPPVDPNRFKAQHL